MLKSIEKLIDAAVNGAEHKSLANHSFQKRNGLYYFYYHFTPICIVDPEQKTMVLDDGGWKTTSTKRSINDYRKAFADYNVVTNLDH